MRESRIGLDPDTMETAPKTGFFNSPRAHFMHALLAHAGRHGRRVAATFAQEHASSVFAQ